MISRYLKTVFFILLVLMPFFSKAQLRPFEDYSKCMTGFTNENGDTLFPAQFESVTQNRFYQGHRDWYIVSDSVYWIVNFHGRYGYLDFKGSWILEPQFDDFSFVGDYLVFKKNDKYGVFNNVGSNILPVALDTIYHQWGTQRNEKPLFAIKKDKGFGLYTSDFRMVIPHLYDEFQVINYRIPGISANFRAFLALGPTDQVYDTLGKPLLPFIYPEIDPFTGESAVSHDHLYGVKNAGNQYAVVNKEGKQLTPWSQYAYTALQTIRDKIEKRHASFASQFKTERGSDQRLINFRNGKISPWYSSIGVAGDWFIVYTKEKWQVLDSNLNVVYDQPGPQFELQAFHAYSEHYSARNWISDYWHDSSMHAHYVSAYGEDVNVPQIFALEQKVKQIGIRTVYGHIEPVFELKYGLFHITTRAQSELKYDRIVRYAGGGKTFYWAVYLNSDSTNTERKYAVDIYDTDVKRLRTIFISSTEKNRLESYARQTRVKPGVNVFNITALNEFRDSTIQHIRWIDGTEPAVSTFDFPILDIAVHNDSTGFVLLKDSVSGNYTVQSIHGEQHPFSGKTFKEIRPAHVANNGYLYMPIVLIGKEIMFTDQAYNVLLDSCSGILHGTTSEGYFQMYRANILAIRNGFLYGFMGGKFELMDSTRIQFDYDKFWITNEGYVDKTGRFFVEKSPVLAGRFNGYVSKGELILEHRENGKSFKFDNIASVSEDFGHFKVHSLDGKTGLICSSDGTWLVKPKYDSIRPVDYGEVDYFLAKDGRGDSGKWLIVSKKGKEVTKPVFDRPFLFFSEEYYALARSNGKMGTLNKKFQWATKPEYDTCGRFGNEQLLFGNSSYAFIDQWTGKSFPLTADSVYFSEWSDMIILLDKGIIEVRRITGEPILRRTNIEEGIANDKIYSFTQPTPPKKSDEYPLRMEDIPALQKRLKYLQVLNVRARSIAKDTLLFYRNHYVASSRKIQCTWEPSGFSAHYYTELLEGPCAEATSWKCDEVSPAEAYINYRIIDDSLVRINELSEIFVPGSDWENRVDQLLAEAIQADQVFGLSCVDIPGTIEQLKLRFIVRDHELAFKVCDYRQTTLVIPTVLLKDVLRWPDDLDQSTFNFTE